jgi:hypothetical protein
MNHSVTAPETRAIALAQRLTHLSQSLRPGQREMADWRGGPLAVSAVPGAGKSYGMAAAAAMTIAHNNLGHSQQLEAKGAAIFKGAGFAPVWVCSADAP